MQALVRARLGSGLNGPGSAGSGLEAQPGTSLESCHGLLLEEVIPVYSDLRNSNPTCFVVNDSSEKERNNWSVISKTILSSLTLT